MLEYLTRLGRLRLGLLTWRQYYPLEPDPYDSSSLKLDFEVTGLLPRRMRPYTHYNPYPAFEQGRVLDIQHLSYELHTDHRLPRVELLHPSPVTCYDDQATGYANGKIELRRHSSASWWVKFDQPALKLASRGRELIVILADGSGYFVFLRPSRNHRITPLPGLIYAAVTTKNPHLKFVICTASGIYLVKRGRVARLSPLVTGTCPTVEYNRLLVNQEWITLQHHTTYF